MDLIYHEFCLAEAAGHCPTPASYLARFPSHAEALARLFDLHDVLSVSSLQRLVEPESSLPDAGDDIGPYRLLREMGRGAFARVFLAEQVDLGDRLVVVKVSTRSSSEPTLLGRARHPHIVEVLRHIDDPESGLHVVCLPFLGGATLGAVLDVHRARPRRSRSGRDLLADLDRASAPEYPTTDRPRPARAELARLSYPKAVAWVVARLAEALEHAWRRGVTHGDLKPSNILLTADGVPMLFDFNLASDGRGDLGEEVGADPGGTLAYMAPERLVAFTESARPGDDHHRPADRAATLPRRPARLRASERHRADLYALGLVLVEALTGDPPTTPDRRSDVVPAFAADLAALRAAPGHVAAIVRSKRVPPALRSILARCLAPDPSDRYAHGGELAEDLDRWRTDRPLVFAPEPRRTAWARRLRRARFPLTALGLVLLVATVVGAVAWSVLEGTQRDQALAKLSYILDRSEGVFLTEQQTGDRRRLGEDPADLANRHLAHYQVVSDHDWRDRPDIRALPGRERGELEAWLLEQILRRTMAYAARPDSRADWRRALVLLDREIERVPYAAFLQQRAVLHERLGHDPVSDPTRPGRNGSGPAPAPEPWLDAYLLGVQAEPLHSRQALGLYRNTLADQPDFFWAHYRTAIVARRIGEYRLAVESLRACLARRPENPALHNQQAGIIYLLNHNSPLGALPADLGEAQDECRRALALDPDHAPATRTQAMLRQVLGQADGVQDDLRRYTLLTRATEPAASGLLQSMLNRLQASPLGSERTAAGLDELSLRQLLVVDPRNVLVRTELANRVVRAGRLDEATQLYQTLIDDDPNNLYARYQHAFCLSRSGVDGSLEEFLSLADHPHLEEFLNNHLVGFRIFTAAAYRLLALDRVAEAEAIIRRGWAIVDSTTACRPEVLAVRNAGEAIFPQGELHYRAAEIDAVAARTNPSRLAGVVKHLRSAFAISPMFRSEWFAIDPYFAPHRNLILQQVDALSTSP